jgi:cation diffusion facilitator CzcD-associated flavoprotein CzcO
MVTEEVDITIIGGGISGITAASYIKSKCPKLKVIVLEARERFGGRTSTSGLSCCRRSTATFDDKCRLAPLCAKPIL